MKQIIALLVLGFVIVVSPVTADPTVFALLPTNTGCAEALGDACVECGVAFQKGTYEDLIGLIEGGEPLLIAVSDPECAGMVRLFLKAVSTRGSDSAPAMIRRTDRWDAEHAGARARMLVASIARIN